MRVVVVGAGATGLSVYLFVANMAHVYPDERSVNNSIRVATEAVLAMGYTEVAGEVPEGFSLAAKYGTVS